MTIIKLAKQWENDVIPECHFVTHKQLMHLSRPLHYTSETESVSQDIVAVMAVTGRDKSHTLLSQKFHTTNTWPEIHYMITLNIVKSYNHHKTMNNIAFSKIKSLVYQHIRKIILECFI